MAFQCFDRNSGEEVVHSHVNITAPDGHCVPNVGDVEQVH